MSARLFVAYGARGDRGDADREGGDVKLCSKCRKEIKLGDEAMGVNGIWVHFNCKKPKDGLSGSSPKKKLRKKKS